MRTLGEVIPTLEKMLAWAKENKDMPMSQVDIGFNVYLFKSTELHAREYVAHMVRSLGDTDKNAGGTCFSFQHQVSGDAYIRVVTDRETVCTARKVKKIVPAQVIPAKPEQVIPEREVEETVWDCGSILAPTETESATV